jgi:hypothetical protein
MPWSSTLDEARFNNIMFLNEGIHRVNDDMYGLFVYAHIRDSIGFHWSPRDPIFLRGGME